ncbi:MAG: AMP-binding protein [bacterium]
MENIGRRILSISRQQGDKAAFIFHENGEERVLSYHDFRRLTAAFRQAIQSKEIPHRGLVLLVGDNTPRWPAAYLGAHLCGLTVIHGDIAFTPHQFHTILDFAKPSLILSDRKFAQHFEGITEIIFLEDIPPLPGDHDSDLDIVPLQADQPMSIIFTSGTTGNPKGAMLSESNFLSNLRMFELITGLISSHDNIVAILPFHHVYPFVCTVLAPLYFGAGLIYPASLRGEDILRAIKDHNGTILVAVPRVLELFCRKVFDGVASLSRGKRFLFHTLYRLAALLRPFGLRVGRIFFPSLHKELSAFRFFTCGGARLEADIHKRLANLGFKIVEAYGLTETSPIAAINNLHKPVPGSVGRPAPGVEIAIQKAGSRLEHGEICIKGPNVMMGYYKRPDLTGQVISDGWFHSGDLGYFGPGGCLFIAGRKDEVIVLSNGKNIYPSELETYYGQSDKIKEICIITTREEDKKVLTAVVHPNKEVFARNRHMNIFQEIKFCLETAAQKLPLYQRISRIELVDEELPKTPLGKVKRYKIMEALRQKTSPPYGPVSSGESGKPVAGKTHDPFLVLVRDVLKLKQIPDLSSNLETDLGLDSLSRLEFFTILEKKYGLTIDDERAGGIFTLDDLKKFIPEGSFHQITPDKISFQSEISTPPSPPLEEHVRAGSNLIEGLMRFCFYLFCRGALKLFFRGTLQGKEHMINLEPPFILAPNHRSLLDGLVIYGLLPFRIIQKCFFLSLPEYFDTFPLSPIRKVGRIILTGTQDTALKSLQYSYQVLASERVLCAFPEGGRSLEGTIEQPKRGIGYVAKQSGAPLVPLFIGGTEALYSRKNPGFHRTSITVKVFPPIYPDGDIEHFLSQWRRVLHNSMGQKGEDHGENRGQKDRWKGERKPGDKEKGRVTYVG